MDAQHRLKVAESILQTASKVTMRHFRKDLEVEAKSDESPVTIADQKTEQVIRAALEVNFPTDAIFGEEFGESGNSQHVWIVDPIDGTRSFISGLPLFGMLLGFMDKGTATIGLINMPALGEMYTGIKGSGAHMNGDPISVSTCKTLKDARLFINEGDKIATEELEIFGKLIQAGNLRRLSADCYPHALVASGHVDAVVDYGLQPYDYLPVSAVVHAAGGYMTDWAGNALTMNSDGRTITAATPELLAEILDLLNQP